MTTVGVVGGTGPAGRGVAVRLASAGYDVTIGSRDEIRARDADKGDAVRTIMNEMHPDIPAAYLGDDTTDEHAFEAMNGRGLSVLVRPRYRATAAQLWVKPPFEVFDLLAQWLHACQAHEGAGYHKPSDQNSLEVNA